jgi:hypothetical protein
VLGIDAHAGAISAATMLVAEQGFAVAEFRVADAALSLPFPDFS